MEILTVLSVLQFSKDVSSVGSFSCEENKFSVLNDSALTNLLLPPSSGSRAAPTVPQEGGDGKMSVQTSLLNSLCAVPGKWREKKLEKLSFLVSGAFKSDLNPESWGGIRVKKHKEIMENWYLKLRQVWKKQK